MKNFVAAPADPNRILEMTRLFRAPKALVLKMWSDPEMITHWWGPMGFSTETSEMDFRPGGVWRSNMIAPDGHVYPSFIRYVETGPDRLVLDLCSQDGKETDFRMEIELEEVEPGRTKMTFRQVHASAAALKEKIEKYGAAQGLADTLTRLDGLLGDRQAIDDPFKLHISLPSDTQVRMVGSFRAPRARVFEALTRAEHISKWRSPHPEFRVTACETDPVVGGKWTMTHESREGDVYRFHGTFLELTPPERFVSTFPFEWLPDVIETDETVLEEIDGLTRMTLTSSFNNSEARDFILLGGLEDGAWRVYDQLEAHLAPQ